MKRLLILLGFFLALVAGVVLTLVAVAVWRGESALPRGERLGVVELKGFISNAEPTVDALRALAADGDVKAVVLRVESPGGGIAPSQEIHDQVARTAAAKPVVVSMGALATSGGYYVSAPATRIVANPGTATGSIGVLIQFKEMHALFDKMGLRTRIVKSGPLKDAGSPFREMSAEETAVFQGLVDDLFDQFVEAVAEGRGLASEIVRGMADGRVYSGRQALELGLVDRLGGFWDAVDLAGELGGISGEPKLDYRRKKPKGVLRWILGEDQGALAPLEEAYAPPPRYSLPGW
ncbi:MAG: signal peptide peptidase SppA [Deferrisomatales bacterium]|nr:signal peptide peptidase SppA [Deferrisomatales bacterium]